MRPERPCSPPAKPFYLALGSSFAAGLGLGPRDPASPYISMRSVNGYPQILARRLNLPSFADMSSSGSTLRHVLHGGRMGLGPQINALDLETGLITLTAGGNDVRFVGDLTWDLRTGGQYKPCFCSKPSRIGDRLLARKKQCRAWQDTAQAI